MLDLARIQEALGAAGLDGWLFYDFRGSDPVAASVLGLDPARHTTRRWLYFIPARGEPVKLVHAIERGALDRLPGRKRVYLPWTQLEEELRQALSGARRVAMQYSPRGAIPTMSRVDAGTVELVRSLGPEVVSSADLAQEFEAVWSEEQLRSHHWAAERVGRLVDETFAEIGRRVRSEGAASEHEAQRFLLDRFAAEGLVTDHPPIVAAGPNSADPHYFPSPRRSSPIRAGDHVLLDLWARKDEPGSVFHDITWVASVLAPPVPEVAEVFRIVREARDAGFRKIEDSFRKGVPVRGFEVDDVVRGVIAKAGHGERFIHRTGHSIHTTTHGNGANLDDLETRDERRLIPRTGFSIEPGIYLEGRFGVRSEVNVYLSPEGPVLTGRPPQREIVRIE